MVHSRLSGSGGRRSVQAVLAHLRSNPRAVILVGRLAMLASASGGNRPMVERVLSQDASFLRHLREALSAGVFSEAGMAYSSLGEAIDVLGLETVVYSAEALTVLAMAQTLGASSGLSAMEFTRHAVATATASAVLAGAKEVDEGRCRLAGLVHNVGVLFVAPVFPDEYKDMVSRLPGSSVQLEGAELEQFGFDHQEAARLVLPTFSFDPDIVSAAAGHHGEPSSMSPMNLCVAMASHIAAQLGCSLGMGNAPPDLGPEVVKTYGFSDDRLGSAASAVAQSIDRMSRCPA